MIESFHSFGIVTSCPAPSFFARSRGGLMTIGVRLAAGVSTWSLAGEIGSDGPGDTSGIVRFRLLPCRSLSERALRGCVCGPSWTDAACDDTSSRSCDSCDSASRDSSCGSSVLSVSKEKERCLGLYDTRIDSMEWYSPKLLSSL